MSGKKLPTFSATQIETFALCPRKWAWRKIAGIEVEPKASTQLGKDMHAQLETWLRDAKPLDLTTEAGQIAMSGLHHLPTPGTPGMEIEKEFRLEIFNHVIIGFKDFEILDRWFDNRRIPLVSDHKSTKDFRWSKSVDDLRTDFQACIYAAEAMIRANTQECDLQWTYYKTTGSRASQPVRLRVTRDSVTPTLERAKKLCDDMALIHRSGVQAHEVPINPTACEAFGGCEYQNLCNLTPQERIGAIMTQQAKQDMFLEKLKARTSENGINPPPMQPVGTPPTPVLNPATGQWEIPQAAPPPQPQMAPPPAPPQVVLDPQTGNWVMQPMPGPLMPPAQVPAAQITAPPLQAPPPQMALPQMAPQAPPTPVQVIDANGQAQWVLPNTAPAQPPAEPPKKRGRPRKAAAEANGAQTEDDSNDDLRTQMENLLLQASDILKTVAGMMKNL
jgi:CRISPR/Cas system-associated exonuclease Cas4 (RecB family)